MAQEFDVDRWIEALAPLIDLDLRPMDRAVVCTHLRIAAAQAATLMDPLPADHDEPAPVFAP